KLTTVPFEHVFSVAYSAEVVKRDTVLMIRVPQSLEDAVWEATRAELGELTELAAAVVDRSRRYTSERERLGAPEHPEGDLAARATFFTVADAMKVTVPLGELANRGAIPQRKLKVV